MKTIKVCKNWTMRSLLNLENSTSDSSRNLTGVHFIVSTFKGSINIYANNLTVITV
ncbi:unnamed protein product [Tenebrio molitor]|nr:unnamed protein product [Tenebrio molitor]